MSSSFVLLLSFCAGFLSCTYFFYAMVLFASTNNQLFITSVVQTVSTLLIAIAGLVLGYFYFFHKISLEKSDQLRAERKEIAKYLLQAYQDYEKLIESYLLKSFGKTEFVRLKDQIPRAFEPIESILNKIELPDEQIESILDVYRFVDKSSLISFSSLKQVKSTNLEYQKSEFFKRSRIAREVIIDLL